MECETQRRNQILLIFQPAERDCLDLLHNGHVRDGFYAIYPDGQAPFQVFCDQTTNGGGFTVFQNRFDGSVDFYKTWAEYKQGFGGFSGEFWLGNDKLHTLASHSQELLVELGDFENNTAHASYSSFSVASEEESYALRVGEFAGTAGDSLYVHHNGMYFSTRDRENNPNGNCATRFQGAWWYNSCHKSNLNGHYDKGNYTTHGKGINWLSWRGHEYSLKSTSMKIRPQKGQCFTPFLFQSLWLRSSRCVGKLPLICKTKRFAL